MDSLYPRTAPKIRGAVVRGTYTESHADRVLMLEKRVEAKSMAQRTLDGVIQAGETAAQVMRFRL